MRASYSISVGAALLAGASLLGLSQAHAADPIVVEAVPPLPAAEPTLTTSPWTGFYIGGHVGYGRAFYYGGRELEEEDDDLPELATDLNLGGLAGGVHAGFNIGHDRLVFGVEGGITLTHWSDIIEQDDGSDIEGIAGDVNWLASLRARLGVVVGNSLVYVTAGVAWPSATYTAFENDDPVDTVAFTEPGGVFGGGVEVLVSDHLTLRAEGLYYRFGQIIDTSALGEGTAGDFAEFRSAFVVRLGVSLLIGPGMR